MVWKKIIVLCVLLSFIMVHPVYAATEDEEDADYSKADYAAGIGAKAADLIIINAANGLGALWKNNTFSRNFEDNQDVVDEYGATRGSIATLVTANPHPEEIPAIKKFQDETKSEWAFLIGVFILSYVFAVRAERTKKQFFTKALSNYDLSDNRFIFSIIACFASYAAPRAVLILIELSSAVSKWAMIEVMDYIEPSIDNAYMYLFMMIGETLVAIPFILRNWILDLAYASSRFVVVLFIMGVFQDEILMLWTYFKKVLSLQPACVFVACGILAIIKTNNLEDATGAYIIMFFFIAVFIKEWLIPGRISRVVVNTAKGAYMAARL